MAVITISRQLGSLGCEVAKAVADSLGYRLVWREVIRQAARLADAPEVALDIIDELGLLGISTSPKARRAYLAAIESLLHTWADEGNIVIVGRAGQVILRDHPAAFHVQVIAPVDIRVRRLAEEKQIPLEASQAQIEASDRQRRSYLRRFYRVDWNDPALYDLVINTGRMDIPTAAKIITGTVGGKLKTA